MAKQFKVEIIADVTSFLGSTQKAASGMKELSAETAGMIKNLKEATAAQGQGVVATGEATKATSVWADQKGKLKEAIKGISREFPILAQAGRLALNPIAAGLTLAIAGGSKLREHIKNISESLEMTEWESYGRRADDGMGKAREAVAGVKRELDATTESTDEASAAGERFMDIFRARLSAEEKMDAAQQRKERAAVNAGEDNPVEKERKMAEIDEKYARRQMDRAERQRQQELAESELKAGNLRGAKGSLENQVSRLSDRQRELGDPEELKMRLAEEEKRLAQTNADIAAKEERQRVLRNPASGFNTIFENMELEGLDQQLDQLYGMRDRQERLRGNRRSRLADATANQELLGQAQTNLGTVTSRLQGVEGMLPTQRAVAGIEREADLGVARLNQTGNAYSAVEASKRVAEAAQREAEAGRGVSEATISLLEANERRFREAEARIRSLEGTRKVQPNI